MLYVAGISDIPPAGLITIGLMVMTGLILWGAGHRVLRGALGLIGMILGAAVGWVVGESLLVQIPSWVFAIVGAVILALVAAIAYRGAVIVAMAILLGITAPTGVLALSTVRGGTESGMLNFASDDEPSAYDELAEVLEEHGLASSDDKSSKSTSGLVDPGAVMGRAIDALKAVGLDDTLRDISDGAQEQWNRTPETLRPVLTVAALIGAVLGILLGFIAHVFSSAVVTSMGGAALWLTGLTTAATALNLPEGPWTDASATFWLGVWLITSAVGLVVQWTFRGRRADKPS